MTPRARIAELEGTLERHAGRETELSAREAEANRMIARFDDFIVSLPGLMWESWGDVVANRVDFISDHIEAMTGYSPREWLSMNGPWYKITHPDARERVGREVSAAMQGAGGAIQSRWVRRDGRVIWVDIRFVVLRDAQRNAIGRRCITLDITALKEAEEERARLSQVLIDAQAAMLAELSTPLIPISEDVMVMPLIGALDAGRADKMLERLLSGMTASRAKVAIVDVTGVERLERGVADALVRAARAVQLIGGRVVLTGIRPEVARALVELSIDLGGIATQSTLASGIAYAMAAR